MKILQESFGNSSKVIFRVYLKHFTRDSLRNSTNDFSSNWARSFFKDFFWRARELFNNVTRDRARNFTMDLSRNFCIHFSSGSSWYFNEHSTRVFFSEFSEKSLKGSMGEVSCTRASHRGLTAGERITIPSKPTLAS